MFWSFLTVGVLTRCVFKQPLLWSWWRGDSKWGVVIFEIVPVWKFLYDIMQSCSNWSLSTCKPNHLHLCPRLLSLSGISSIPTVFFSVWSVPFQTCRSFISIFHHLYWPTPPFYRMSLPQMPPSLTFWACGYSMHWPGSVNHWHWKFKKISPVGGNVWAQIFIKKFMYFLPLFKVKS